MDERDFRLHANVGGFISPYYDENICKHPPWPAV